jgi:hypothetical protein
MRAKYSDTIEEAITKAIDVCERVSIEAEDGTEAYAYPVRGGSIAWGVNAAGTGVNILRGIRRPDGADECVS